MCWGTQCRLLDAAASPEHSTPSCGTCASPLLLPWSLLFISSLTRFPSEPKGENHLWIHLQEQRPLWDHDVLQQLAHQILWERWSVKGRWIGGLIFYPFLSGRGENGLCKKQPCLRSLLLHCTVSRAEQGDLVRP